MTQDEHERGSAIIRHHRGLRAAEFGEALLDVRGAFATAAGGEVDFEIGVAGVVRRRYGRAAEVGVDDDAGGVDDMAGRRRRVHG